MMSPKVARSIVDWHRYAEKYDMLLAYNPFYQQLHQEVLAIVRQWSFGPGEQVADVGAGTGNYSIALASLFPQVQVFHIDSNEGMNSVMQRKKEDRGLENIHTMAVSIDALQLSEGSLSACLCIHALYTFPNPQAVLKKIHTWMKLGARGIFVDPGRLVNVFQWQLAIGWHMIRHHGWRKTLKIMREGREVSYQNRQISKLQARGIYWQHSHAQFCDAVSTAGFDILESHLCFRNISDMVVVRKI